MIWIGLLVSALLIGVMLVYARDSQRYTMILPEVTDGLTTTSGYTVMLCHKRAKGVGRGQIRKDWSQHRADLIRTWQERIGFSAYVQVHQVSRLSITYNLVLASRSWPLIAVISILHGIPVPRKTTFDKETREERWDAIEQFDFVDRDAALRFLSGAPAADARAALMAHTLGIMRRSHAIFMRTSEAYPHDGTENLKCYTLFTLRSRTYLGAPEAMRYWLTHHRPFVVQQQPVLEYHAYFQHVAERSADLDAGVAGLSHAQGDAWDAVASLQHPSFAALVSGIVNPRILMANSALVNDEARFLDTGRSALVIGVPLQRIA